MKVTTYQTAHDFLAKTQKFLEQNEAANNLILGLSLRLRQFSGFAKNPPHFATVTEEDELKLAAVLTPPRALVIYHHHPEWRQALPELAQALLARAWPVPGVMAHPPLAQAFASLWARLNKTSYRLRMRNRLYQLQQVKPVAPTPGRLRLASGADLDLLTRWTQAFQQEALPGGGEAEAGEVIRQKISAQDLYVWEDGQPVSLAGQSRPTENGICLSLVYTPPEYRRKGYATACVAGLSQHLLDSGRKFCVLFTDLANPTSNHIYQAIGYTPLADFDEYMFEPETRR